MKWQARLLLLLLLVYPLQAGGQSGIGGSGISDPLNTSFSSGVGYVNVLQGLNFVNPIDFGTGSTAGPANALIWSSPQKVRGTCTSIGNCNLALLAFGDQAIVPNGGVVGFEFDDTLQSPGTGARTLGQFGFTYQGSGDSNGQYTALATFNQTSANNGGTSPTSTKGSLFGLNPYCRFSSGATFWTACIGVEVNVSLRTGSSARDLIGIQVVPDSLNAVPTFQVAAAYSLNTQPGALGLDYFLMDGSYAGFPGLKTTGILIGCVPNAGLSGGNNCGTIGSAFELGQYTQVTNYIIRGPGAYSGGPGANGYIDGNFNIVANTQTIGSTSRPTLVTGEQGFAKISASGVAPGAGFTKIEAVAGTNAGSCKLIAYAGTSATPVTILDNIGAGC